MLLLQRAKSCRQMKFDTRTPTPTIPLRERIAGLAHGFAPSTILCMHVHLFEFYLAVNLVAGVACGMCEGLSGNGGGALAPRSSRSNLGQQGGPD